MSKTLRAVFLALSGGICWGISGSVGQYLFTVQHMDSRWLVPIRLGLPAFCSFCTACAKTVKRFFLWRDKGLPPGARRLRTLRHRLQPVLLLSHDSARQRCDGNNSAGSRTGVHPDRHLHICTPPFPKLREIMSLALALVGVLLLASHGSPAALSASAMALLTGVASGVCVAIYNLAPVHLSRQYPMPVMLSWAFLMGGAFFALFFRIWTISYVPDAAGLAGIACVVIVGNILAFSLYMTGLKAAGPVKAVLFGFSEPVTAAILTVVVFHGSFNLFDLTGFICIFIMLVLTAQK